MSVKLAGKMGRFPCKKMKKITEEKHGVADQLECGHGTGASEYALLAQLSCLFHFEGSGAGRCNTRCSLPMGFKRASIVRRQWDSFC